jgi:hypothetical protein
MGAEAPNIAVEITKESKIPGRKAAAKVPAVIPIKSENTIAGKASFAELSRAGIILSITGSRVCTEYPNSRVKTLFKNRRY